MSERTHRLVTAVLQQLLTERPDGTSSPGEVLAAAGQVTAQEGVASKPRGTARHAADLAGTYLAHLCPALAGMRFDGCDDDRALHWRGEDGAVADVLAVGDRTAPLWTRRTSGAPRRVWRAGADANPQGWLGVRVLCLAAPRRSLLVDGARTQPRALVDTAAWLGPRPALSPASAAPEHDDGEGWR